MNFFRLSGIVAIFDWEIDEPKVNSDERDIRKDSFVFSVLLIIHDQRSIHMHRVIERVLCMVGNKWKRFRNDSIAQNEHCSIGNVYRLRVKTLSHTTTLCLSHRNAYNYRLSRQFTWPLPPCKHSPMLFLFAIYCHAAGALCCRLVAHNVPHRTGISTENV